MSAFVRVSQRTGRTASLPLVTHCSASDSVSDGDDVPAPSPFLPSSPPLSFQKFLTLQSKRVVVTIQYTGGSGLRPLFLTTAKKIKAGNGDVLIEKVILPVENSGRRFEVLVDRKLVVGKSRTRDIGGDLMSVYLSMSEIDVAIAKARRKRRPSTTYNAEDAAEPQRKKR